MLKQSVWVVVEYRRENAEDDTAKTTNQCPVHCDIWRENNGEKKCIRKRQRNQPNQQTSNDA